MIHARFKGRLLRFKLIRTLFIPAIFLGIAGSIVSGYEIYLRGLKCPHSYSDSVFDGVVFGLIGGVGWSIIGFGIGLVFCAIISIYAYSKR